VSIPKRRLHSEASPGASHLKCDSLVNSFTLASKRWIEAVLTAKASWLDELNANLREVIAMLAKCGILA